MFYLGARDKAIESNLAAQRYCTADPEGMKDLQQQYSRFMTEISESGSKGRSPACPEGDHLWVHKTQTLSPLLGF